MKELQKSMKKRLHDGWALAKQGAVTIVNAEGATVDGCFFNRVDGNGVFIGSYNRNATVKDSEFAWIGATAIAAWGDTGFALNSAASGRTTMSASCAGVSDTSACERARLCSTKARTGLAPTW